MNSAITLTQLRYFVQVAHSGSFGTAADRCHVTQPTLSMQIQKLEQTLGVVLLDRSRKPIVPTSIGNRLLERANQVLQLADSLGDVIEEEQTQVGGELRLGVIPTLAPYLIPRVLPSFVRSHPSVKLVVEECETQVLIDRLRLGSLDAGFAATPLQSRGILERPLFRESFSAYLSKGHPLLKKKALEARDLRPAELWLLAEGHCFRTQVLNFCRARPDSAPIRFDSGNLETLRRLVDAHSGATLLPQLAVEELPAKRKTQVRPFRSPSPVRQVSLVHNRTYLRHRMLDALTEAVQSVVPELLGGSPKNRVIPLGSFD